MCLCLTTPSRCVLFQALHDSVYNEVLLRLSRASASKHWTAAAGSSPTNGVASGPTQDALMQGMSRGPSAADLQALRENLVLAHPNPASTVQLQRVMLQQPAKAKAAIEDAIWIYSSRGRWAQHASRHASFPVPASFHGRH